MKLRICLPLVAALMLVLSGPLFAADVTVGKIKSVSADKNQFVLTDNTGKEWQFNLKDDGKIRASDKTIRLNEIKDGSFAMITYDKKADGTLQATSIRTPSADAMVDGVTHGTIKSVDADKNQFVLTDSNNKDFLFTMTDKGHLWRDDQTARLNDLKSGDHVAIAYNRKNGGLYATDVAVVAK